MDKSYVSLEQHICPVCGKTFDTGAILLDRRMRNSMERYTVTGFGLCPEHEKLFNDGFIALVEIDAQRSNTTGSNCLDPSQVYRTGCVAHLRKKVFDQICNIPVKDKQPFVFVEQGFIQQLQAMVN